MANQLKILETDAILSQSLLWPLQTAIYSQLGAEAWTKKGVPSYMTSNPLTAYKYAQLVVAFLRDTLSSTAKIPLNLQEPLYFFDLGAGTGRFAYVFLKQLMKLLQALPQFAGLRLCYILTDIVDSNLQFCRNHSYLKPYFDGGILDIAYYRHDQTQPLHLQVSDKVLSPADIVNPAIIIANYFFDTVPKDLFCYRAGVLHEGTVTVKAEVPEDRSPSLTDPDLLAKIRYSFDYRPKPSGQSYYQHNSTLQQVLEEYSNRFDGFPFTLPLGAISTLEYFQKLSNGRLFVIAGDQGYATLEQIKQAKEPYLSLHGSFSIPVNYHAVCRYFDHSQGAAWLSSGSDPMFQVFCGAFGATAAELPETALAYQESIESFEPKDYWRLVTLLPQESALPSLETLLLILKIGRWDPTNCHAFFGMIREQLPDASPKVKELLRQTIHAVWEHFYPIQPLEGEFVLNLGVLLFEMHYYAEALAFFQHSLVLTGDQSITYRNMAACYKLLFNAEAAHRCQEKAAALEMKSSGSQS
jgi:tetratricopeptide (TPR) repeat protein